MIRKAYIDDLDDIMECIEDSRALLKSAGSPQWNESGYPYRETLMEDIEKERLYCYVRCGKVIAIEVIAGVEPVYDLLDGKWILNTHNYRTIHRLAIKKEYRGKGIAKELMEFAYDKAASENCDSIRIDTYRMNDVVKHLAIQLGYVYCGIVDYTFEKDGKRLAYECVIRY